MKTLLILLIATAAYGCSTWNNDLADAIYKAEGGGSISHPYGILSHYQHTTPRQACLNTIAHAEKRWERAGRPSDFVEFLAATYCPVGAANDPSGLNRNWVKNVKHFMQVKNQPFNPSQK